MSFKEGDLIFGRAANGYVITNDCMVVGLVTKEFSTSEYSQMRVKVIKHIHSSHIGEEHSVINDENLFTKIDKAVLEKINGLDAESIYRLEH